MDETLVNELIGYEMYNLVMKWRHACLDSTWWAEPGWLHRSGGLAASWAQGRRRSDSIRCSHTTRSSHESPSVCLPAAPPASEPLIDKDAKVNTRWTLYRLCGASAKRYVSIIQSTRCLFAARRRCIHAVWWKRNSLLGFYWGRVLYLFVCFLTT